MQQRNNRQNNTIWYKCSKTYADKQTEIAERIKMLRTEIEKAEAKTVTIATVRKYTKIKKLTREILQELINEIKINHTEKLDSGETIQIITIYWNCIGVIEIPDLLKISDVDVTVNTRKGVNVKYEPKLSLSA